MAKNSQTIEYVIEAALLMGATRDLVDQRITDFCTQNENIRPSEDEINKIYSDVLAKWVTDAEQSDKNVNAYHIRVRKHLYQRAYQLNDFKACLAIMTDLGKIQKQYINERKKLKQVATEKQETSKLLKLINSDG